MPRYDLKRYGRVRASNKRPLKVIQQWELAANVANGFMTSWRLGSLWDNTSTARAAYSTTSQPAFAALGDSMSYDNNGRWTFPHTGLYKISWKMYMSKMTTDSDDANVNTYGYTGSYYLLTKQPDWIEDEGYTKALSGEYIFDVDTSTKRWMIYSTGFGTSNYINGAGTVNFRPSYVMFERIGDSPNA